MNVLITSALREETLEKFKELFHTVSYHPWKTLGRGRTEEELLSLLEKTGADALITELDHVTEGVLDRFPNLQFIGDCRAKPANVDVTAASQRNIPVICTPARNAQAVAELLAASVIAFFRNLIPAVNWLESGNFQGDQLPETPFRLFMGDEIHGKRMGFVGFGAVARHTAPIMKALGCEIFYYDPYVTSREEGFTPLGLWELFQSCDIVSIHLPVIPSTEKIINRELLSSMKRDSLLVNTARAFVIDCQALYELLKEKKIKGAVLDVYEQEPLSAFDVELIHLDNVLATPHICGATYQVAEHQSDIIYENVKDWLGEKKRIESYVYNREQITV